MTYKSKKDKVLVTAMDLKRLGLTYECGVVWHWSKARGNYPLKRKIINNNGNVYYCFRHNGTIHNIREEVILKAFVEGE